VRDRTGVFESGGVDRPAEGGTVGASRPCWRLQFSHFKTAARRVLGERSESRKSSADPRTVPTGAVRNRCTVAVIRRSSSLAPDNGPLRAPSRLQAAADVTRDTSVIRG
jgi:hypothetical protein